MTWLSALAKRLAGPPRWQTIQYVHVVIVFWTGTAAVNSTERRAIMLNAAICGSSIAAIGFIQIIKFYQRSWHEMMGWLNRLRELNHALLEEKFSIHIAAIESDEDAPKRTLN